MKVYAASKAAAGMWEHKPFATGGLITSNSSIPCIQKTHQMRRDKPETQEYMLHFNALNSAKNRPVAGEMAGCSRTGLEKRLSKRYV